jgi:hypothetical protein
MLGCSKSNKNEIGVAVNVDFEVMDILGFDPHSPYRYVQAFTISPRAVKLSMCLIKHYAMKTYGGVEV